MSAINKTIALVGKSTVSLVVESLLRVADFLREAGHTVVFEEHTAKNIEGVLSACTILTATEIGQQADLAIVIGGDGTMLAIARQLAPYSIPLVGINQGRLGFMTDIAQENMLPILADMLSGKYTMESRSLLEGTVLRDNEVTFSALAFNDIVVSRGAGSGMVELRVDVDDHFMYNQRSDGLIVATPTGSTAYALSAGGPLLHPDLGGITLVPIAPHTLSNRPIVISDASKIAIGIMGGSDISVSFDMQSFAHLLHGDRLHIKRSAHLVNFMHPQGWNYFNTLRDKLYWNEQPKMARS